MAPVSSVFASSSRVKCKCFGPAEKLPSMGLKHCLLLGFINGLDFQGTVSGIDARCRTAMDFLIKLVSF